MRLADRMTGLGTETAFEVLAKARQLEAKGRNIVHLEIGEPDFDTPAHIQEAGIHALKDGFTHYTPAGGILKVREAVTQYIRREHEVEVSPFEVVMVPGSKNVLTFTILALINPGDEVIVPDPGYPIYSSLVTFVGGRSVPLPLREANNFRLDPAELKRLITPKTRLIIINSPHNPTGGVLLQSDLEAIAELAIEHDLVVLSDEVYSQIIYEGQHHSILSIPGMKERTVLSDGLSKAYAMCGWRLGFAVAPLALAQRMETLMINTSSCAAAFTQIATIEALLAPASKESVRTMVAEFARRRDVIVRGLNELPGVRCHSPAGAFYVFPNVTGTRIDEHTLADRLLNEAGVAVLPGTSFGAQGKGYLRLSYASAVDQIEEGLRRIRGVLEKASAA
jgi:aspartate/methionine/tyrosine aminotransferase